MSTATERPTMRYMDAIREGIASEMRTDPSVCVLGIDVGSAATGLKPVVELMFMDFLGVCFDALLNQAAKLRYMTGGLLEFPLVVRTQIGAGQSSGAQHSQR